MKETMIDIYREFGIIHFDTYLINQLNTQEKLELIGRLEEIKTDILKELYN